MRITNSFAILSEKIDPVVVPSLLYIVVKQFSIVITMLDPGDLGSLQDERGVV